MLLLSGKQVLELYSPADAYQVIADVMRRYSGGGVVQPVRTVLSSDRDASLFASMPCHVSGEVDSGFGLKAVLHVPGNAERGLVSHVGAILVFHPDTGQPLAVIDAAAVTSLRTAAASAVATDALARADAGDLALLGAGVQARSHLVAMNRIRTLRRVRVWNRTPAHAEQFRAWARSLVEVDVELMPTPAAALRGADVVCTTLGSSDPVVSAADIAPGCHVNAVGASVPSKRELDSEAVASCSVFVDSREAAMRESSEITMPLAERLIPGDWYFPEIGEVLLGRHPGRTDRDERTLYKSLGMAAQDVASGFAIVRAAQRLGVGTVTDIFS
ncbi:ornithine cyclodeaminase family protein [Salinispora tropica]|uniref:Ornithine cyclodeaminase n=1 Tax=Salinispora tropica (strain ATCC BAA-916 / DSM 44818 / JCM 13857 / NBRC 105044 / CNB-440) TaxID=369723 RepID=A4X3R5_SALTO|nr:ornithine cyclodeaminase family protein [Salinispora tropica]ABP53515.1 ornithine cyclodeaminase [Salinispora tropica CNB-440]